MFSASSSHELQLLLPRWFRPLVGYSGNLAARRYSGNLAAAAPVPAGYPRSGPAGCWVQRSGRAECWVRLQRSGRAVCWVQLQRSGQAVRRELQAGQAVGQAARRVQPQRSGQAVLQAGQAVCWAPVPWVQLQAGQGWVQRIPHPKNAARKRRGAPIAVDPATETRQTGTKRQVGSGACFATIPEPLQLMPRMLEVGFPKSSRLKHVRTIT